MKATLEFNLPDERHEFEVATRAAAYNSALDEIFNLCRTELKHGEQTQESLLRLVEKVKEISQEAYD